jgi:hypothetical protein
MRTDRDSQPYGFAWTGVRLAALLSVLITCGGSSVTSEPDPPGLRVLFIGNSLTYTNAMPEMVQWMLERAEVAVGRVESVAFPDVGLQDHWVSGPARERIAEGHFDVVVLQQGPSATEGRPSLLEFSQRFADEIRAAGGQPALYMVWPSVARFFDFDGVSDSYRTAAQQTSALLFPAGEAWRAAWRRDSTLALYGPDEFHPSVLGSYLAALVIFEQLAHTSPTTLPALVPQSGGPTSIAAEVALLLQEAAAEANAQFARTP